MWWRLKIIALTGVSGMIDFLYAVEGAYFVPAIYDKGLSTFYGSMLLSLSPVLGILFQSYLGSASDQCKCRWGKRRPFILALTICCICGLVLFPFTEDVSDLLGGARLPVLIVLTVIATTLVDFGAGALQVPSRAYLLDVLPQKHTKFGNILYSVWVSVGATIGFAFGAINWSSDFSTQVKIVCGISLVITVICVTLTLFSVDEQNPQVKVTVKETTDASCKPPSSDNGDIDIMERTNDDNNDRCSCDVSIASDDREAACNGAKIQGQCAHMMKYLSIDDLTILPNGEYVTDVVFDDQKNCGCDCISNFTSSLVGNYRFTKYMSSPMWILTFAYFFGFLAIFSETFFFTDYVADTIYNGDITAPENSTAYKEYIKGVRIGSLAFGVASLSSLITSMLLGPTMKLIGTRPTFVASYVVVMMQSGIMIFNRNVIVLFLLSATMLCNSVLLTIVPFILISQYETKSILLRKVWPYADKNLIGRACSVLITALLLSQTIALLTNGPLQDLYGGAESVMIITCASSFVGAVIACFVTIPPTETSNKNSVKLPKIKEEITEL